MDSGHSGAIPVDSGPILVPFRRIPVDSGGITGFRTESVGHQKVQLKGSTKGMVQMSDFVPLPFALYDLDQPDKLICDPEGVKAMTCKYFQWLYDHNCVHELPKPWLTTPLVTARDKDPFH